MPEPVHSVARLSPVTVHELAPLPALIFTVPTRVGGWATSATAGTVSGLSPPTSVSFHKTLIVSQVDADLASTCVSNMAVS